MVGKHERLSKANLYKTAMIRSARNRTSARNYVTLNYCTLINDINTGIAFVNVCTDTAIRREPLLNELSAVLAAIGGEVRPTDVPPDGVDRESLMGFVRHVLINTIKLYVKKLLYLDNEANASALDYLARCAAQLESFVQLGDVSPALATDGSSPSSTVSISEPNGGVNRN